MTPRDDPEQQQAELLWKYIDELKRSDHPESVQFVAVTRGECSEVVGLMETAAEAFSLARAESAPNCAREAVRQRLQSAIAGARPASEARSSAPEVRLAARPSRLPAWLAAPLSGRSTGWAVAVAALVALIWTGSLRPSGPPSPPAVSSLSHGEALDLVPQLIAGTLDIRREREAWAHFNNCDHCFQIFEEKWRAAHARRRETGRSGLHPEHQASLPAPSFATWHPSSELPRWAAGVADRE
jgi:hypothetical protein